MAGEALARPEDLEHFLDALFRKLGMTAENAACCAADLVLTNLWGIDSHGVLRLPVYAERLLGDAVTANPRIRTIAVRGAFEVMDGDAGMGFVVGHHAMGRAVDLASKHGIGAVTVRNSNHFGAAGLYAKQATNAGYVALAMSNVMPNLVVSGGSAPITGNNPLAFGAPTRLGHPLLLDISMSSVAGGKLLLAIEKEEKIPFGWATDRDGRPTDDPSAGFAGFLLPVGGHKGFGLSLMIDILCGILSGGAFQHHLKSMYAAPEETSATCHLMIAIDPTAYLEREAYLDRMDELYRTIKASPTWDREARMLIPGELENEALGRRRKDGIPLPRNLVEKLDELADRLDCPRLTVASPGSE